MKTVPSKLFILLGIFLFTGVTYAADCTEPGSITRVKNTSFGRYEYVVFDIKKRPDGARPDYKVTSARPPFTDYSGDETYTLRGGRFKKIVFRSINWMCEIPERYYLPRRAVKDIKKLSVFEGVAEFVVGYRSRSRYVATYSYDAGSVTKVVMRFRK